MWGLLAVIGLGLVAWIVLSSLASEPVDPTEPTPTPTVVAEQQTLLLQVRNDDDLGANNLIAGVGGGLPPAQLLVASRLIVDVPGAGQQTLGQSARQLDRSASQDALSDLLALRIDGTLSLGRLALAGMVDFVGGITVDVDRAITTDRPRLRRADGRGPGRHPGPRRNAGGGLLTGLAARRAGGRPDGTELPSHDRHHLRPA